MPNLLIDGVDVHVAGEGGQSIVMIHGWPDTYRLWDAQAAFFRDRYRCVRFTLPGFVYSVGLPPVIAAAAHAALEVLVSEPARPAALQLNAEHFLNRAEEAGLATGSAVGRSIIPVLFPDLTSTMECSDSLLKEGIYAPPIVQVGVPKHLPRIRFFISARHTFQEIDRTVATLESFILSGDGQQRRAALELDAAQV